MLIEFGHFTLILALFVALAQGVFPLVGVYRNRQDLMFVGDRAAKLLFLLLSVSMMTLILSFLASDFSVKLAADHSHSAKPFLYKISGVWGNHEGSILLWTFMLALYGALIPIFGKYLPPSLKARAVAVQGLMTVGFIAFIIFTSNPFERLNPVPIDGNGLNPILQDPGLAIHPPLLYLGYVGFSVAFSFSIAALLEGRVDASWAKWVRPWVLVAWSFLTLGITMGSLWAYYELGWGGWWMWDPVENVSFMPWLVGTALLHSIRVLETRHKLANSTILLGITAFSLSLIGTFVVRSGVLVSVHAFSVDPKRGVFILALLMVTIGSALTLYALRAKTLKGAGNFVALSREGGLIMNNLLLLTATTTVFLGTFYPLMIDAISGAKLSVGQPYFEATFAPIMMFLILFMGGGPSLKWNGEGIRKLRRFALLSLAIIAVVTGLTYLFGRSVLGGIGLGFAAYLVFGTVFAVARRSHNFRSLRQQPASTFSFALSHLGVAVFMTGVVSMSVWSKESMEILKPGESLHVGKYEFAMKSVTPGKIENYQYIEALITVSKGSRYITTLRPERRFYPIRGMITSEAGFHFTPGPTLFVSIGEGDKNIGWAVRANFHPFVIWIWIGAFLMSMSGFLSLVGERRKRKSRNFKSMAMNGVLTQ